MANPQHIEWLLEGVDAWNKRREAEPFTPDFEGADIRKAFKEAGKLASNGRFYLDGINLSHGRMKGVNLHKASLRGANLSHADLTNGNLSGSDLGPLGQPWTDGLNRPESELPKPQRAITSKTYAEQIAANPAPIILTGSALLEMIQAYKEQIRSNNELAVEHPEFRDGLLQFLEDISTSITQILGTVPKPGTPLSEEAIKDGTSWANRFINAAIPAWKDHLDAEKLGNASAPIGIILTCGTFGCLISGLNPLGFGAGALVGKWLTGEMKSGTAADKLAEHLDAPDIPMD